MLRKIVSQSGREVVFQCRDEGLLRARVRWIRGNGLPLPPGSRDLNGRLEIPNIQIEHAGTYICEAVGYPPSTPGRQVSVDLTVEKCTFFLLFFVSSHSLSDICSRNLFTTRNQLQAINKFKTVL